MPSLLLGIVWWGTSTPLHAFCKERQQRKVVSFWKFSEICGSASEIKAGLRKNLGPLKAITLKESDATVQQTYNPTRLVFNPVCVGGRGTPEILRMFGGVMGLGSSNPDPISD